MKAKALRLAALALLAAVGMAMVSSCGSSSTPSSTGAGGAGPGVCPLYAGSLSVTCPAGETLVCGFVGEASGCCPTVAPYYCGSTQSCYETADAASAVCGSDCQQCLPLSATTVASATSSSSGGDAGSACNGGLVYSQPAAGSQCMDGPSCMQAPFSCISPEGQQQDLVCCCDPDGTLCVGCTSKEVCSGAIANSPVSCCPM